jgi:hypothetical protein
MVNVTAEESRRKIGHCQDRALVEPVMVTSKAGKG